MSASTCAKVELPRDLSCLGQLADGGNTPQDLCPACTRAFMAALDAAAGEPLVWHPAFSERAR